MNSENVKVLRELEQDGNAGLTEHERKAIRQVIEALSVEPTNSTESSSKLEDEQSGDWVRVPWVPTEAMLSALAAAVNNSCNRAEWYAHALSAAPQPPTVAQADEVVCLECGQPTMHMGQVCYACSHPAAKPAEAPPPSVPVEVEERARETVALALDERGHHADAYNVRNGIGLDYYRVALSAARIALAQQPAAVDGAATNSAVAAIQFALKDPEGMTFLRLWNEGDFDTLRREWPDAPVEVYIDADPLVALAQQPAAVDGAWLVKARELYDRCSLFPENTTDGFMALLELRNHVHSILAAQPGGSDNDR